MEEASILTIEVNWLGKRFWISSYSIKWKGQKFCNLGNFTNSIAKLLSKDVWVCPWGEALHEITWKGFKIYPQFLSCGRLYSSGKLFFQNVFLKTMSTHFTITPNLLIYPPMHNQKTSQIKDSNRLRAVMGPKVFLECSFLDRRIIWRTTIFCLLAFDKLLRLGNEKESNKAILDIIVTS